MPAGDDFNEKVKRTLAGRAGHHCSYPGCYRPTSGPDDTNGVTLVGVACHIHAARQRGPRYDSNQTSDQRKSLENGIWLCADHHIIIDRNPGFYDADTLRLYKEDAEKRAFQRLVSPQFIPIELIHNSDGPQGTHGFRINGPVSVDLHLDYVRAKAEKHFSDDSNACFDYCLCVGYLLKNISSFAEAEFYILRSLACAESIYGPNHPSTALSLISLAHLQKETNRLAEAEPLIRRALEIYQTANGFDHYQVAKCLHNLATLLYESNRLPEAEPLIRRALKIDEAKYGSNHPEVALDLHFLACLLAATNKLNEAAPLWRKALNIFVTKCGPNHPQAGVVRRALEWHKVKSH